MEEFWTYLRTLNWRALLLSPTENTVLQMVRYLFVGGFSFLADAGLMYLLTQCSLHYAYAAAVSFFVGLVVNFLLSKRLIFRVSEARARGVFEFLSYGLIGVAGLGLTELLLYLFTEKLGLYFMVSKIIAAAAVLVWNFACRKWILYKSHSKEFE